MNRVQVKNDREGSSGTECFINDSKVPMVKGVDFHVSVGEVPQFTFQTVGVPDIDMTGDVNFEFTPRTIQEAMIVLQKELSNEYSEIRKAFEASVRSAILDSNDGIMISGLAKKITDRVAGCDGGA